MLPSRLRALAVVLLLITTSGCGKLQYLLQAGVGQLDISSRARPLGDVKVDKRVDARTRELLAEVSRIKQFGEKQGLRPTKNYERYADLERNSAVWVVSASEPLAFKSKTWWFPITGSVPYLGYFSRADADLMADYLRDQGYDVDVRGAEAYSTIGWFDDPVLSTMIPDGDEALGELTDVVLHESVHATVYVPGEAGLNETVASFIGDRLAVQYLAETHGLVSKEKAAFVEAQDRFEKRQKRMHAAYDSLAALYASKLSREEKLAQKKLIFDELMRDVHARRRYNNATLAELKTYNSGIKELEGLLESCGNSYPRLVASLKTLDAHDFRGPVDRDLGPVFASLAERRCPLHRGTELADAGSLKRKRVKQQP